MSELLGQKRQSTRYVRLSQPLLPSTTMTGARKYRNGQLDRNGPEWMYFWTGPDRNGLISGQEWTGMDEFLDRNGRISGQKWTGMDVSPDRNGPEWNCTGQFSHRNGLGWN